MSKPSHNHLYYPRSNLRVVRSETTPSGENIELIRPMAQGTLSSGEVVQKLINQYDYKSTNKPNGANVQTIARAFPKYAQQLVKSNEGSNIVTDTQQDLIGDRYLTEQIKRINEENKNKSILDKWGHLLYEGDKEYKPSAISLGNFPEFRSVKGSEKQTTSFVINKDVKHF